MKAIPEPSSGNLIKNLQAGQSTTIPVFVNDTANDQHHIEAHHQWPQLPPGRYEVLAWLRDKGRDKLVLDEEVVTMLADESAEREPQLERQREALESCMQKVAPDQRDLLMQAYQPQARMQEVAQASGRTVTGFYQWLHRMRRSLMDCIRRALAQEVSS